MTNNAELIDMVNMVANRTWWGGSIHYLIMSDGESLCATCAKDNYELIATAIIHNDDSGWRAVGVGTAGESEDAEDDRCAHCHLFVDE